MIQISLSSLSICDGWEQKPKIGAILEHMEDRFSIDLVRILLMVVIQEKKALNKLAKAGLANLAKETFP